MKKILFIVQIICFLFILAGSIIYWNYYFSGDSKYVEIGLYYTIATGFLLVVLFVIVVVIRFDKKEFKKESSISLFLILITIIIGIIYLRYTLRLNATDRINIVNRTDFTINNLYLTSCENQTDPILIKPKESKEIWIYIKNSDCKINAQYEINGKKENMMLNGYPLGGSKYTIEIKK